MVLCLVFLLARDLSSLGLLECLLFPSRCVESPISSNFCLYFLGHSLNVVDFGVAVLFRRERAIVLVAAANWVVVSAAASWVVVVAAATMAVVVLLDTVAGTAAVGAMAGFAVVAPMGLTPIDWYIRRFCLAFLFHLCFYFLCHNLSLLCLFRLLPSLCFCLCLFLLFLYRFDLPFSFL